MVRLSLSLWLKIVVTLACLSQAGVFSQLLEIPSINMVFEDLNSIDLSPLGTPNLDRYKGYWDITVDEACNYMIKIVYKHDSANPVGQSNYQGDCQNVNTGTVASDGLAYHANRRNWIQFPSFFELSTGFNHMSLQWRPCGLIPLGFRQARYDMIFFTILPQYRAFMRCQEFRTPAVCQYNQTDYIGRMQFSLPTMWKNPNFIPNMPTNFEPDPNNPIAFQYEGLISYDPSEVPQTPTEWALPQFHMSSYDAHVVSWRGLIPYTFISGGNSSIFHQTQYYVYQTMTRLPSAWNLTYDAPSGNITVLVQGASGICGTNFENQKQQYLDSLNPNPNPVNASS